jgi:hypothetical protein
MVAKAVAYNYFKTDMFLGRFLGSFGRHVPYLMALGAIAMSPGPHIDSLATVSSDAITSNTSLS